MPLNERLARLLLRAEVTLSAMFLVVIVLCVSGQFVGRSVFGIGLHWTSETARFAFVWCTLLGGAAAWQDGVLHRVDVLLRALRGRARMWLEALVLVLVALALLYLIHYGIAITQRVATQTSSTLQISMAWVYAAAPVACALMLLGTVLSTPKWLRAARDASVTDEADGATK
ncbi:TRAP transporter small permease [Pseudazoarcus pumilus]|uniref:TRAP transporter small permease protein n=1 Tax=Pseudazoarcus pumilus TaxID=2067960 RepID=A0A2I6S7E2_9RHOO|nr:TRAP transporter small permease [Pseudazoarcus pumilus]AUN95175.1 hypothetical protein C0099_09675 [Pseudazoarcus pumilus]